MTLTKISMPYDLEALHHHNDLASLLRPDSPDPLSDAPPSQDSTTSSTQNPISYMTIPSSTTNMEHINMSLYSNTTARLEFRVPPISPPHSARLHPNTSIPTFSSPNTSKNNRPFKQTSIWQWTSHCPFITQVTSSSNKTISTATSPALQPTNPRESFSSHLFPFGTPLPYIDPLQFLRICV